MTSTTVDALKALYVALGGDASDVADLNVIPDVINKIAQHVASGGAAELPAVTNEDNGKVLKVVDGEWSVGTDNIE
jgi:hypothetical protein